MRLLLKKLIRLTNQLSFSRSLAIKFFICSLLTFIVIDIAMHALYSHVVTAVAETSAFNTLAFSQFSNTEIVSSAEAYIHSGIDIYEDLVSVVYTNYLHFVQKPQLYTSKQQKLKLPQSCETFQSPRYDRSCMYHHTPTSTFHNQPYLDKVLASLATKHYPTHLKRINIIHQSMTNLSDISIRTMPATNDFYVSSQDVITQRRIGLQTGVIYNTDLYQDGLSTNGQERSLFAVRLLVIGVDGFFILIQVEVDGGIYGGFLQQIYSFPSTKLVLLQNVGNQYVIIGKNNADMEIEELSPYMVDGSVTATLNESQFMITTRTYDDTNNNINSTSAGRTQLASSPTSTWSSWSQVQKSKMIIFLNRSQSQLPNNLYKQFLQNQYTILVLILYGWTMIVLLIIFAIGFVVGDIIFSYFCEIRKNLRQYLQDPTRFATISSQMTYQYQDRVLFQNMVAVMHGIEAKKKDNRSNFKIAYDVYPYNPMDIQFQTGMCRSDYQRLEKIAQLIKQRRPS